VVQNRTAEKFQIGLDIAVRTGQASVARVVQNRMAEKL
jgi:hypothetical protein